MKHYENIVIGKPICTPQEMFCTEINPEEEWMKTEKDKTLFTEQRFLPDILVELKIAKSKNEVTKNRPELFVTLDKPDFLEIKWGKKKLWILVGN